MSKYGGPRGPPFSLMPSKSMVASLAVKKSVAALILIFAQNLFFRHKLHNNEIQLLKDDGSLKASSKRTHAITVGHENDSCELLKKCSHRLFKLRASAVSCCYRLLQIAK